MRDTSSRGGLGLLRRARAVVGVGAAGVVIALALSGCASPGAAPVSVALSETAGYPADAPVPDPLVNGGEIAPFGWLSDDRGTITIITYGSSSCPYIGTAISTIDASLVRIEFEQAPAEACTEDLGSRTHVFSTPSGIGQGPLNAELSIASAAFGDTNPVVSTVTLWPVPESAAGDGETLAIETLRGVPDNITLPDGSLDKGDPLAFWSDGRGTLRVITWGSSGCPPPALSLDIVSPTALAMVFGPLPPQACTADFAPTTHVLAVPAGLDAGTVTLGITIEQRDAASLQYSIPIVD